MLLLDKALQPEAPERPQQEGPSGALKRKAASLTPSAQKRRKVSPARSLPAATASGTGGASSPQPQQQLIGGGTESHVETAQPPILSQPPSTAGRAAAKQTPVLAAPQAAAPTPGEPAVQSAQARSLPAPEDTAHAASPSSVPSSVQTGPESPVCSPARSLPAATASGTGGASSPQPQQQLISGGTESHVEAAQPPIISQPPRTAGRAAAKQAPVPVAPQAAAPTPGEPAVQSAQARSLQAQKDTARAAPPSSVPSTVPTGPGSPARQGAELPPPGRGKAAHKRRHCSPSPDRAVELLSHSPPLTLQTPTRRQGSPLAYQEPPSPFLQPASPWMAPPSPFLGFEPLDYYAKSLSPVSRRSPSPRRRGYAPREWSRSPSQEQCLYCHGRPYHAGHRHHRLSTRERSPQTISYPRGQLRPGTETQASQGGLVMEPRDFPSQTSSERVYHHQQEPEGSTETYPSGSSLSSPDEATAPGDVHPPDDLKQFQELFYEGGLHARHPDS